MSIKIKILRRHNRAEDCRTVHHFLQDQIVSVSEQFANKIINQGDGILFVENEVIVEPLIIEPIIEEVEEVVEEIKIDDVVTLPNGEEVEIASIPEEVEEKNVEQEKIIEEKVEAVEEKPKIPESKFTNKFNPFKKRK